MVLRLTHELGDDLPLMTEHMSTHEEYLDATTFIRDIGEREGISIKCPLSSPVLLWDDI
jgi:hypothetical protein